MARTLVAICCLLAMGMPAFAGAQENDVKPFTAVYEGDQALVQTVQWGGGRMWTCVARGRGGRTFLGQSTNANAARRIALNRCWNRSSGCIIRSCR